MDKAYSTDFFSASGNFRDKERYSDRQDRNRATQYNRDSKWDVEVLCWFYASALPHWSLLALHD